MLRVTPKCWSKFAMDSAHRIINVWCIKCLLKQGTSCYHNLHNDDKGSGGTIYNGQQFIQATYIKQK